MSSQRLLHPFGLGQNINSDACIVDKRVMWSIPVQRNVGSRFNKVRVVELIGDTQPLLSSLTPKKPVFCHIHGSGNYDTDRCYTVRKIRDEQKSDKDNTSQSSSSYKTAWHQTGSLASSEKQCADPRLTSVVAALSRSQILALPCLVGSSVLFLAVFTCAAINIIFQNAFRAITQRSSVPVQLLPNDLNVVWVTGSNL